LPRGRGVVVQIPLQHPPQHHHLGPTMCIPEPSYPPSDLGLWIHGEDRGLCINTEEEGRGAFLLKRGVSVTKTASCSVVAIGYGMYVYFNPKRFGKPNCGFNMGFFCVFDMEGI